ncbi:MAG TPA: hypothetical protein PLG43_14830, partial [Spirochaetia bacterium]|nr:hypothetical protein [Spirochaetia bacterium]
MRIGNTDLGIFPSGYMSFPDASVSSLGASILFASEHSSHEIMFRYDPSALQKRVFSGTNSVTDERLSIRSFIRGRFFSLPVSGISGLSVYVECTPESGDISLEGRRYRKAKPQEASLSGEDGLITFSASQKKRVIATYDGIAFGPGPGEIPSDYQIDTSSYFILYEPGRFSPFELCQYYASSLALPEDSAAVQAYLVRKNSSDTKEGIPLAVMAFPSDKRIALSHEGTDPLSYDNRWPFQAEAPDLYDAAAVDDPAHEEWEILLEVLSAVSSFSIDEDALAGSVQVRRNGIEESGFTVESGIVSLATPVYPDDRIEITYRTEDADALSGDILFGFSNLFTPTEHLSLSLGLGVRWNVFPDAFTSLQDESAGSIILSGGLSYDSKDSLGSQRLAASLDGGLSLGSPD